MVALTDIPLVLPLAEWIWGGGGDDDDDTKPLVAPQLCLSQLPFLSMPCFKALISKALGVAIIAGSCLNKIPIMINMMNSQSAAGISRNSLYGEAVVYANGALYGFLLGYPFTSYGENASLLLQNVVLIAMAWHLSQSGKGQRGGGTGTTGTVTTQERLLVILGFLSYFVGILQFLPDEYYYLLLSTTWPVMLYARGSQVWETFQVTHTGNLSIVTTTMNLIGSLIRIGTTMQETGDNVVLAGYLLSGFLSLLMFIQYWLYLGNTRKLAAEQETEKDATEAFVEKKKS